MGTRGMLVSGIAGRAELAGVVGLLGLGRRGPLRGWVLVLSWPSPPKGCVLAGWEVLVVRAKASALVEGHLQVRFCLPDLYLGSQQHLLALISFDPFEAR